MAGSPGLHKIVSCRLGSGALFFVPRSVQQITSLARELSCRCYPVISPVLENTGRLPLLGYAAPKSPSSQLLM